MALLAGHDWKSETYLSLAGVFQTKRENVVPVALSRFLDEHPSVRKIHLHLDNDAVGRGAVKGIVGGLQGRYQVYDEPPSRGKDVNDELKIRVGLKLSKQNVILYLCGIIPVVWLGLLIAPCLKDGLPGLVQQFGSVMQNPFKIQLCEDSVKTVLTYLCIIPGKVLADIYDKYGSQLLEGNVRSFLSTKVAVNKKIRETILKCPSMFFAYNNGVSATAMDVQLERTAGGTHIVGARDFQIINGGQTTASLSNTRHKDKADLEGIYVQMKLTEIDESDMDRSTELVRNISRSSNSQNKVTDADFFSTHPFHIRMEQHSRRIFAPAESGAQYETKWFYERAKGQFLQAQMRLTPAKKRQFLLQNPKSKVITKTDLAKVRNTWSEMPHIVSKGAQTNFMKFAELIDEAWTTNDSQFNERYFTESVALVILFKHLEALIPRQEWYEQGYRANIVTYSLALLHQLIRKQFKNMELDLQSIWQRQSVPEIVTKALEQIAEQVFYRITDPNRPTINVTQWCKREGCWNSVQEINLILPAEFSSVLIGKTEVRAAEKEARKDQKVLSETEAQVKVLQYSADQWKKLSAFVMQKRMASPDENVALKYACQIPNKMPSGYQSQRLLALLDRALSEGFNL